MGKFIKQQINLTVSVVIPTIGRESIIQAIQSVIDQSTDATVKEKAVATLKSLD